MKEKKRRYLSLCIFLLFCDLCHFCFVWDFCVLYDFRFLRRKRKLNVHNNKIFLHFFKMYLTVCKPQDRFYTSVLHFTSLSSSVCVSSSISPPGRRHHGNRSAPPPAGMLKVRWVITWQKHCFCSVTFIYLFIYSHFVFKCF